MTMVNGIGPFFIGNPIATDAAVTITNQTISSTNKMAAVFQVPKTGSIRKLSWLCSSFSSSGGNLDVRLETVGATTGDPSGTLYGTNTNGAVAVSATGWITATLTADAAVTKNDIVALVVQTSGGAAQSLSFGSLFYSNQSVSGSFPYTDRFVASWGSTGSRPIIGVEYSDGSYAYIANVYPISAVANTAFASSSTPDEKGNKYTLSVPVRVIGARVLVDGDNDFSLIYYNNAGSAAQTKAWDKDWRQTTSSTLGTYDILFDTPQSPAYNDSFRLSIRPDTTSNISVQEFTFPSTAVLAQFDAYGTAINGCVRTDAGAWTEQTTTRYCIWPLIDGLDNGQTPGAGEHSYAGAG